MDKQSLDETIRRSGRETRLPTHLEDYEVEYPRVKGAACQTEGTRRNTNTHGLQDVPGEEQRHEPDSQEDIPECADHVPINQAEIMKEILVTMRDIRCFMERSHTLHSSSKYSSKSGSPAGNRNFVCNQPPIYLADPQAVHYESPPHQSSSRPPDVSRHPVAVSSAMPHLPELSILDAAVPTAGLPRPILYSQDMPPSSFHAASPEGQPQRPHVQPSNRQVNPSQPLVSLSSQQRQSPSLMPQTFTSSSHKEQRSVAPPPGRTHVYKLEGPSFPNLTREDEMQYRTLRMALSNLLDPNETEHFKYHVLLDHLKVDQAKLLPFPMPLTHTLKPSKPLMNDMDNLGNWH